MSYSIKVLENKKSSLNFELVALETELESSDFISPFYKFDTSKDKAIQLYKERINEIKNCISDIEITLKQLSQIKS